MSEQIMLPTETSLAVQALADKMMADLRALVWGQGPDQPLDLDMFLASVGVQAVLRGLVAPEDHDQQRAVLIGGGEGVGMIVGLIADPLTRMGLFQACVAAMHTGLTNQARIHVPMGEG